MTEQRQTLPAGATDCHFHIFDDRFAQSPGRNRGSAPVSAYEHFRDELGLSRGVLIAPSSYGHDNSCLFDALQRLGNDRYRAVIIPPNDLGTMDWRGMHSLGVRGLRLYAGHGDFTDIASLKTVASRVADAGWHLQLVGDTDGEPFVDLVSTLSELPCPLVFDHFAFAPQPNAERSRTADFLRRLLDEGKGYVKLSGMYIQSKDESRRFADFDALALDLIRRAPERMLWGSDWPHTLANVKPNGTYLLDCLRRWAPGAAPRI